MGFDTEFAASIQIYLKQCIQTEVMSCQDFLLWELDQIRQLLETQGES